MNPKILIIGLILIGCSGSDQQKEYENNQEHTEWSPDNYQAVDANNQITSIQKASLDAIDTVFRSDTGTLNKNLDDAIFELNIGIGRLESIGRENEIANYFSKSVIELLKFYKNELEGNFQSIIPILKKASFTDKDTTRLGEYDRFFVEKEAELFNEIVVRQDSFANYFKISLKE